MPISVAMAIAAALMDSDASVVTQVPGHGATETFSALQHFSPGCFISSFHEEVAFTIAHGAALTGTRAAALIKAHGFTKATNSLIDSLAAGTTAGCVVVVFDDKLALHSDSSFDFEAFLRGTSLPFIMLNPEDAYSGILSAFRNSEALQLPLVVVVDSADVDLSAGYEAASLPPPETEYVRDAHQHVVCPLLASYQKDVLDKKLAGEPWVDCARPALPVIPDEIPQNWKPQIIEYQPLFDVFKKLRGEIVTGDAGLSALFAMPPYDCIDLSTYMGGSIPLAIGASLAGRKRVWAVTGDFSFIAAGHLGLLECLQRELPLKTLVIRNGKAAATGGQPIPDELLDCIIKGYSPRYTLEIKNPFENDETERVLTEAVSATEMRIVVADYRNRR